MNPRELLEQHNLLPKKGLGQNFLHDTNVLDKIVAAAELTPDDTALEIGAGTGTLTEVLARSAKRVIAVEIDDRLRPILEERLSAYPNVEFIYEDILATEVSALIGGGEYVVVANVPYYITSAILRHLFESDHRPRRLIITMQLEVAERLIAKPGEMSILSVSTQFYAQSRIVARLKPGTFWPRPEVDSAVVRMDTHPHPPVNVPDEKTFFRVVRAGFSQKRKQLKNSLGHGLGMETATASDLLERSNIDPRRRPETLTLEDWAALTREFAQWHTG
jgi:16S rRNA (adenine1518-N6/adenine1519-N6)-dimethyltransferase